MSEVFETAYSNLIEFIRKNPSIEIGDSVTSIPGEVRTDFYSLFNAARTAFIGERFPDLLRRAEALRDIFGQAERDLAGLISLEEPPTANPVLRFLRDPADSMSRELFDPLFDLLKARDTLETFESKSSDRIKDLWPAAFRGAYEKWVVLSLVKLLEPQQALKVEARTLGPGERARAAAYAPFGEASDPEPASAFLFSQPRNALFSGPDLIIRSARLNRFVAFRSEFKEGLYNAINASNDREWIPLDTDLLVALDSGLTLVYVSEQAQDIAMVADATRLCRPDLVLWCLETDSISREEALAQIADYDSRIRPVRGSFILAEGHWPEPESPPAEIGDRAEAEVKVEESAGIRLLEAGFDPTLLGGVVEALAEAQSPALT